MKKKFKNILIILNITLIFTGCGGKTTQSENITNPIIEIHTQIETKVSENEKTLDFKDSFVSTVVSETQPEQQTNLQTQSQTQTQTQLQTDAQIEVTIEAPTQAPTKVTIETLPLDPDYKLNILFMLGENTVKYNSDSTSGGICPYEFYKITTRAFYNNEGESQYLIGFYAPHDSFGSDKYIKIRNEALNLMGLTVNSKNLGGINLLVGDYDGRRIDFFFYFKK